MSRTGLPGFDGGQPDFALGFVRGVRWWGLRPDLSLTGVTGFRFCWEAGENTARCGNGRVHAVPDEDCGCGFWAYWDSSPDRNPHNFDVPVFGVIEGYGRTLIGDRGFRCFRARIAALHLPAGVTAPDRDGGRRFTAETRLGSVNFRSADALATWQAICGRNRQRSCQPERPGPDESLARKAAAELALEDHYSVPVYASQALMLVRHPPTADYLPQAARRPVRLPGPVLTGAEALARMRVLSQDDPALRRFPGE